MVVSVPGKSVPYSKWNSSGFPFLVLFFVRLFSSGWKYQILRDGFFPSKVAVLIRWIFLNSGLSVQLRPIVAISSKDLLWLVTEFLLVLLRVHQDNNRKRSFLIKRLFAACEPWIFTDTTCHSFIPHICYIIVAFHLIFHLHGVKISNEMFSEKRLYFYDQS